MHVGSGTGVEGVSGSWTSAWRITSGAIPTIKGLPLGIITEYQQKLDRSFMPSDH